MASITLGCSCDEGRHSAYREITLERHTLFVVPKLTAKPFIVSFCMSLIGVPRDGSKHHSIVMFSGGRDSTLVALRLHDQGYDQTLITVASDHLTGIHAVGKRLRELREHLPQNTRWMLVQQPKELLTDTSFYEKTCLPCHHAYVVVASAIAIAMKAKFLSFGYVGYQNSWPEQTPLAVERLEALLKSFGVGLLLPVYDLPSKEAAKRELATHGLAVDSLEQKCTRQVQNIQLSDDVLGRQISLWEEAIKRSISQLGKIHYSVLESKLLSEM